MGSKSSKGHGQLSLLWIVLGIAVVILAIAGVFMWNRSVPRYDPLKRFQELSRADKSNEKPNPGIAFTNRFQAGEREFTQHELQWMASSELSSIVYIAAICLWEKHSTKESLELFEKLITMENQDQPALYMNKLQEYYTQLKQYSDKERILRYGISKDTDPYWLQVWYGECSNALVFQTKIIEAYSVIKECLEVYKNIETQVPDICLLQAGIFENMLYKNLTKSIEYWNELYTRQLQPLIDTKENEYYMSFIPFALQPLEKELQEHIDITLEIEDMQEGVNLGDSVSPCASQPWPYIIEKGQLTFKTGKTYEKMECKDKIAPLYHVRDVVVLDKTKQVLHYGKNGDGYLYVPGFPFTNSFAYPRNYLGDEASEIKTLDNVLFIHALSWNYFHFTVEGIPKILLMTQHPHSKDIPDLKILVERKSFIVEELELLGLSSMLEYYDPEVYHYHIKNLYIVDWRLPEIPEHRFPEDYYMPPLAALQYTRSVFLSKIPVQEPRNLLVFLHRQPGIARSATNYQPMYDMLNEVAESHGLEVWIHGLGNDGTLFDQMKKFSRTIVLIGVHGAGLTNMMFCREKTAIIEIPNNPPKVSEYIRMASYFDFPYFTIDTNIGFFYFTPATSYSTEIIDATKEALHMLLPLQGFSEQYSRESNPIKGS